MQGDQSSSRALTSQQSMVKRSAEAIAEIDKQRLEAEKKRIVADAEREKVGIH